MSTAIAPAAAAAVTPATETAAPAASANTTTTVAPAASSDPLGTATPVAEAAPNPVSSAVETLAVAQTAAEPPKPNLAETMEAVKSGAINANVTSALDKVGSAIGSLPSTISDAISSTKDAIASQMASAQANLSKSLAVAQSNLDLKVKLSFAQTGLPPSQEIMDTAKGPLAIFTEGPKMLEEQLKSITGGIAGFASSFGAKIGSIGDIAGAGGALDKFSPDKLVSAASAVGSKVTEFFNTIPPATIPNPLGGDPITNPDFTSFASANGPKLGALDSLTSAAGSLAGSLSSNFDAIKNKAEAALAGGIGDLKAFAFAASLGSPVSGTFKDVVGSAIDMTKVDPVQISQTMAKAAANNPAVPKPDVEVKEPPVPEGTVKDPGSEKITATFPNNYKRYYVDLRRDDIKKEGTETKAFRDATWPDYEQVKQAAKDIEKNKPDSSERTPSEQAAVEKYSAYMKEYTSTEEWKTAMANLTRFNERVERSNELAKLYLAGGTIKEMNPITTEEILRLAEAGVWGESGKAIAAG